MGLVAWFLNAQRVLLVFCYFHGESISRQAPELRHVWNSDISGTPNGLNFMNPLVSECEAVLQTER